MKNREEKDRHLFRILEVANKTKYRNGQKLWEEARWGKSFPTILLFYNVQKLF